MPDSTELKLARIMFVVNRTLPESLGKFNQLCEDTDHLFELTKESIENGIESEEMLAELSSEITTLHMDAIKGWRELIRCLQDLVDMDEEES